MLHFEDDKVYKLKDLLLESTNILNLKFFIKYNLINNKKYTLEEENKISSFDFLNGKYN